MKKNQSENDQLGVLLKRLLEKESLSMRKLSERTAIDTATISRIINGKRNATLEHLHQFSLHLNISMNKLLEAAGYPISEEKVESELSEHIENIQHSLEPSIADLSKENIERKLKEYATFVQTSDGEEEILSGFEQKIKKVDSVGPFIKNLKGFFEKFRLKRASSAELILMGSVLLYFIVPVDVIPDYIFPIGYIDDALAVQMIAKRLGEF